MRDKKRIPDFCNKLQKHWEEQAPDFRFGQLMSCFLGWAWEQTKRDIFYLEDKEMAELLDQYFAEIF